jgi:predicted amino acid-binding ACT domain protein
MSKDLQKELQIMNLQMVILAQRLSIIQILLINQNTTDSHTLDTIEEMEDEIRQVVAQVKILEERNYAI